MRYLIKRNLLVFFRDKASVFFSLLSVFIIIGLYLLFLGDVMKSNLEGEETGTLIDAWIMAGVIAIAPITTGISALGIMVEDRKLKIYKDFYASPLKRSSLAGGYILSCFTISLLLTLVTLIFAEVYIVVNGGELLSWTALAQVLGIIILSDFLSVFVLYFFVSFFKSSNAFSAAATIIGTLIGFLTGIYIPMGSLPDAVQMIVKIFPPSHAAMMLREIMMGPAEETVFKGVPETTIEDFQLLMGSLFKMGDFVIQWWHSLLYMLILGILFFLLSMWKMARKTS
ncbi:ABC transporter permease [Robertmurraya yapensis]|uniref:ABC transporter permease n=2 Tax=Bacillaceae TaxID=186817 RepID=A0A431VX63_9BACI|nr:ABC transporter permease [Bacillus yapensis]RTR27814.1 ABC transporter permease [Bacillus yapensis]TKS94217.1 ABC transporter permease [Bacillus yapensis]